MGVLDKNLAIGMKFGVGDLYFFRPVQLLIAKKALFHMSVQTVFFI